MAREDSPIKSGGLLRDLVEFQKRDNSFAGSDVAYYVEMDPRRQHSLGPIGKFVLWKNSGNGNNVSYWIIDPSDTDKHYDIISYRLIGIISLERGTVEWAENTPVPFLANVTSSECFVLSGFSAFKPDDVGFYHNKKTSINANTFMKDQKQQKIIQGLCIRQIILQEKKSPTIIVPKNDFDNRSQKDIWDPVITDPKVIGFWVVSKEVIMRRGARTRGGRASLGFGSESVKVEGIVEGVGQATPTKFPRKFYPDIISTGEEETEEIEESRSSSGKGTLQLKRGQQVRDAPRRNNPNAERIQGFNYVALAKRI